MAIEAPAYLQVHPSFTEPQFVVPYAQASGAFDTLPDQKLDPRLDDVTLAVYIKKLDMRTNVAAGQSPYNELPSCSIFASQISTPTYWLRVNAQYDHHDTAMAEHWGLSVVDAHRLAMWQAHFQFARTALLYGFNPVNGEGLLNGAGSTSLSLPQDSNGNTTVLTYDNGQLALFLLQQVLNLKSRTFQLGTGRQFVILGPQRVLGQMEYPGIVTLTQFQRDGAGTSTIAGMVKDTLTKNGDRIMWVYDDTLIGKGSGGTDAVILTMPQVERNQAHTVDTNIFGTLTTALNDCNRMYCNMPAPREIPTPVALGGINVLSEWKITSGWPVRPEATVIMSMAYQ